MLMRHVPQDEQAQHLKNIEVYGFTRVENLLEQNTLVRARNLVLSMSNEAVGSGEGSGNAEPGTHGLLFHMQNRDKLFIEMIDAPFIGSMGIALLNDPYYEALSPDVPNYILAYYNARSSQEDRPLRIHIDSIIPAPGPRTWAIQVVFPLDDQAEENGCTVVVPGSHISGRYTDRDLSNIQPIESRAGDAILWDSRLWHGALPNRSGAPRWALIATFHMWWLKQKMDIVRTLPEHIYAALSDRQKQLMGYCAIPPRDAADGPNTKRGYEALKPTVADYFI